MTEIGATISLSASNGRPIKFTPERFDQIRNLVERGKSREEIAELIGCTVGSLQVTCSNKGISLRRFSVNGGVGFKSRPSKPATRKPAMEIRNGNGEPTVTLTVVVCYRGAEKRIDVPVTVGIFTALLFKAELSGVSVGELIARALEDLALT